MLTPKKLLASLALTASLVNGQNFGPSEPVYFLNDQGTLFFGGVFELFQQNSTLPQTDGFQLAEALSCGVNIIQQQGLFPGVNYRTVIRDDRDNVAGMVDDARIMGDSNVVIPVVSVNQEKLNTFYNGLIPYKAPAIAYMPPESLTNEGLGNEDLLFAAPVDSYQTAALVALAKGLSIKRFGVVGSKNEGMTALVRQFGLHAKAAETVQVTCQMTDHTDETQRANFIDCMSRFNINALAVFSTQSQVNEVFDWLKNTTLLSNQTIIFGSSTWANQATFDSLIANGVSRGVLNNTVTAKLNPGRFDLFQTCLANRTSNIQPYEGYSALYAKAMKCNLNGTLPVCAAGRNLADPAVTADCNCRSDENLSMMPLTNPGINYVIDAVFSTAFAFSNYLRNCPATAAALGAAGAGLCDSSRVTGPQIAAINRVLSFNGLTGKVQWSGKYRRFAAYDYFQFNGNSYVRAGNWSVPDDLTNMYNDATIAAAYASGKPDDLIQDDIVSPTPWTSGEAIAITVITTLGLVATLLAVGFVVVYRDNPVIKRASPLFCALMLGGIAIMYFQLYLWMGPQSQGSCVAKIWMPIIGFSLLMGPMLAKTFRIWKIFDNSKLRARRLLTGHLIGMSAAVLSVNLILLIIWTAVEPLHPIISPQSDPTAPVLYSCGTSRPGLQIGFIIAFAVYNGVLLVLGSYLSYKTRSVVSSFNESTFIAYTMYNFLLCMVVLLPIYYAFSGANGDERVANTEAHFRAYIIRSAAFLFANTACLVILFGPKLYHVIKKTEDKGDLPTAAPSSGAKKPAPSTSKAGTSAPTGAKTATLVGGAGTQQSTKPGEASRPGATVDEKSAVATTATKEEPTATQVTSAQEASVYNAGGVSVIGNDKDGMTSTVQE